MEDAVFLPSDQNNAAQCTNNYLGSRLLIDSITMSSPKLTNKESDNNLRRASETSSIGSPTKFRAPYCIGGGALEMLIEPVEEESANNERPDKWEYRNVSLSRVSGYGFGIAVSGGRDNPHFKNGDPSIVVSDVLHGGPASELLQVNDRIISANGLNLEKADYATAVQIMRDSEQLNLIVKRRVPLPVVELEQKTLKFTLTKTKKKDDFGIILGCRFYIKQITNKKLADKEPGLKEGDSVLRINDGDCDQMTMADARKLLDKSRERLSLVIRRDVPRGAHWKWSSQATLYERLGTDTPGHSPTPRQSPMVSCRVNGDLTHDGDPLHGLSSHTRGRYYNRPFVNSQPSSRSRTPNQHNYGDPAEIIYAGFSPRNMGSHVVNQKTTVTGDDVSRSSSGMQLTANSELTTSNKPPLPSPLSEPRFVSFCKEGGSVGVRVIGGNEVGIFVSAVQTGSPAFTKGVKTGDKILRVNDRDMRHVTREEAVLHLLSVPDQVDFVLQYKREEFDRIRAQNLGDNFFVRTHFAYEKPTDKNELAFKKGDIFQVVDTLFGGTVGNWQAAKVSSGDKIYEEPPVKGIIPNSAKAEQVLTNERAKELKAGGSSNPSASSLIKRKMSTLGRKSKSANKCHSDEVAFTQILFPAYERVRLRHSGFLRPVVIFGPLADIASEKLLQDFPLRFSSPSFNPLDQEAAKNGSPAIIRLSSIKEVMSKNKHCLLDVTPNSIEKLQYAQFCPIVVYINVESRNKLRDLRLKSAPKAELATKSTKKLMDDSNKLSKTCRHLVTAVLDASQRSDWFDALRELICHLQERRVWMAETLPTDTLDDDFLFSMSSDGGHRPGSGQKSGSANGESDADSTKADQSDYYGTLKARKVQNKADNEKAQSSVSNECKNLDQSTGDSNFAESNIFLKNLNASINDCAKLNQQESSSESAPSAPCTNGHSTDSNATADSTSSYCSSTNNTVKRVSCSSNGSAIRPFEPTPLVKTGGAAPNSPGSSNNANFSYADHVTRFDVDRPDPMVHMIDRTNALFTPETRSNYRGHRQLSEPGFYDVKQILQGHTVDDYAPLPSNYVSIQKSNYVPNDQLLTNSAIESSLHFQTQQGSKFTPELATPPSSYYGQRRELRLPSYEDYKSVTQATDGSHRSKLHAISRTPSNPVPLPSHYSHHYSAHHLRNAGNTARSPHADPAEYSDPMGTNGPRPMGHLAISRCRVPPPPAPRSPHFTPTGRLSLPVDGRPVFDGRAEFGGTSLDADGPILGPDGSSAPIPESFSGNYGVFSGFHGPPVGLVGFAARPLTRIDGSPSGPGGSEMVPDGQFMRLGGQTIEPLAGSFVPFPGARIETNGPTTRPVGSVEPDGFMVGRLSAPSIGVLQPAPLRTSDRAPLKMATLQQSADFVLEKQHLNPNVRKKDQEKSQRSHENSTIKKRPNFGDKKSSDLHQSAAQVAADLLNQRSSFGSKSTVGSCGTLGSDKSLPHQAPNDPTCDQSRKVLAHVSAKIGVDGGTLVSESTKVVLKIPPGALRSEHELFFKVFQDSNLEPPLDKEKGEKMLTPLLMFGPPGLVFSKPVELLLPHNLPGTPNGSNQWSLALKTTTANGISDENSPNANWSPRHSVDQSKSCQIEWQQIPLADAKSATPLSSIGGRSANVDDKYASILLDNF